MINPQWAENQNHMATKILNTLLNPEELQLLLQMARAARIKRGKKPNAITRWCGPEATSSRRTYQCRICLKIVDTESARNKPTKRALKAVHEHGKEHLLELGGPTAIPMISELVESPGCKDMSFEEIINAIRTGAENGTPVQTDEDASQKLEGERPNPPNSNLSIGALSV